MDTMLRENMQIRAQQGIRGQDESMLIDFGKNGLLPIQNLIANPAKKSAMKAYIESYLKK